MIRSDDGDVDGGALEGENLIDREVGRLGRHSYS